MPYGPKSPETVLRYAREAARFLVAQNVKAIVVACNTATAHARRVLAEEIDVPVIGVVDPGAQAAVAATKSGMIGVIGTRGTIESGTYERAVLRARRDVEVFSVACPLFVSLAEEGWVDGPIAQLTAEEYLSPLLEKKIDTLLLGCTHYPLLAPLIGRVSGSGVTLVDSAAATAAEAGRQLDRAGLNSTDASPPERRYFVTDDEARFTELAQGFLGAPARAVDRAVLEDEASA